MEGVAQFIQYLFGIVLLLLFVAVGYYLLYGCYKHISFTDFIKGGLVTDKCVQPTLPTLPTLPVLGREVFHISDQVYTYEEAKCKCESYGGRLATEAEVVAAYNNGAHWCTYGWCQGQHAFYPVNEPGPDCKKKRGIYGGYFPNPNLKFGINCYGPKPRGTVPSQPVQPKDLPLCMRPGVKELVGKNAADNIAPFNSSNWNGTF